jgi:hypothetical protein
MKKTFLCAVLCGVLVLGMGGSAMAALINFMGGHGDRVVYDDLNDLYWYPYLTDFSGMTRAQQEAAIDTLEYAGSRDWRMATYEDTTLLKVSLAENAANNIEWNFAHLALPDPIVPDDPANERTLGSPYLAWPLDATEFFTPTITEPIMVFGVPAIFFNGRYDGPGWVNPGVVGEPVIWDTTNTGSDHWASWNLATPDAPDGKYLTMVYNYDGHLVADDALNYNLMGMGNIGLGAWAVSETAPVPEPATMVLWGSGLIGFAAFRRRTKRKGQ